MEGEISFDKLNNSDLIVDRIYKGGNYGNAADDPINKLLKCGNQGGFRYAGNAEPLNCNYIVLYSSLEDPDWPDFLDMKTGIFTYYGDNKRPGHELHDTRKKGNIILRNCFELLWRGERTKIPPFFVFNKGIKGRDVIFRGIAVPGGNGLEMTTSLVAVWKSFSSQRFQNYKAQFTILDIPTVKREWINELNKGNLITAYTPNVIKQWYQTGKYTPLIAEKSIEYRRRDEQIPKDKVGLDFIAAIYSFFQDPYKFEACAAEIIRLMDANILSLDLTRPWVDGGRDGLGKYRIGTKDNAIEVEFAIEAKRYDIYTAVGVKETSRLISRIRHRQFGILITTSFLHHQAYKEIVDDKHPIIIVCAQDIVNIFKNNGISSLDHLKAWLENNFN